MTQVVQAKCPHCQNVLRIPADWLAKPMRCKFCKQVIQARTSAPEATTPRTAATAIEPAPVAGATARRRSAGGMFEFEEDDAADAIAPPPTRRPASKGGKGWIIASAIVASLAVAAVLVVVFAGDQLRALFQTPTEEIVENEGNGGGQPGINGVGVGGKGKKKGGGGDSKGLFPRRALLINVNNYWLLNPVHYGTAQAQGYPGSSTAVLAGRLSGAPMYFPATQVAELSDGAAINPTTPSKFVIEAAITDFLSTAREQDRLLILFAGHAVDIEKEAYLVPFEGNKDDPKTLIPLSWVYEQLAQSKARQKILVLDAFRLPARGYELPGTGAMTEEFEAKVDAVPAGVQVWVSCQKEQQSVEFNGGGLFLQCVCHGLQDRLGGFAKPDEPIPVEALVAKVNQRMKDLLATTGHKQESRLVGKAPDAGAAYDDTEPLPPKLVWRQPAPPTGDDKASGALINNILAEMKRIPPMKPSLKSMMENMRAETLPPFSKKVMDFYTADYKTWEQLAMKVSAEKYPLRHAVLEAKKALDKSEELKMRDSGSLLFAPVNDALKKTILAEQAEPALFILEMEDALALMKDAAEKRDKEDSKRWQAHFDYTLARLQGRLVYINEYNFILADIRGDRLPELEGDNTGWALGFKQKLSTNENKVKTMAKDMARLWKKIAEDHPGTPWALLAQRESLYALGMQWKASRQ